MTTTSRHTQGQSEVPKHVREDDYSEYFDLDTPTPEPPKVRSSRLRFKPDNPLQNGVGSKDKGLTTPPASASPGRELVGQNQMEKPRGHAIAQSAETLGPASTNPLAEITAEINDRLLCCNRLVKACVKAARDAGRSFVEAQNRIGKHAFDAWADRTLPVSPAEANALIAYSSHPDVAGVDVSPGTAVPLNRAASLLGVLCELTGQSRPPDPGDPDRLKTRRRVKPR